MNYREVIERVRCACAASGDLLRPQYMKLVAEGSDPLTGHCYNASEAIWHALGGPRCGWVPCYVRLPHGATHWFLRSKYITPFPIIDATVDQFEGRVPDYHAGRPCGFQTKRPSRRAREILRRAGIK